ncbi:MAG: helix-turn-helix domain-containing protein, partial [Candidatus Taylorbacteria bacterium]|nr:helix-turn-helix domain-containing protein [Candidatus Taylorbacteria bacterium]
VRKRQPRGEGPFGGLQVVLVGDFFQLPPVFSRQAEAEELAHEEEMSSFDFDSGEQVTSKKKTSSNFAFASPSWQNATLLVCYLSEQHRQDDKVFLEFLSAVRRGVVEERHKVLLRTRYAKVPADGITKLYSHNIDVDHLNENELAHLSGDAEVFKMNESGREVLVSALKRGCLSPEELVLKRGARVMFTKNDMARRFVNGTIGRVVDFAKEGNLPIVKTDAGRTILVEPMEWNIQDEGRVLARITQLPLRLAWAITVHKSQGMSLDSAHMDLSGAFEYGQGYVAISRVRTLKGLTLSGLNVRALEIHPEVKEKDEDFRTASDSARLKFNELEVTEVLEMHRNFIRAIGGAPGKGRTVKKKKEKVDTIQVTKELVLQGLSIREMAVKRKMTAGTIIHHLEQLKMKGDIDPKRDISHLLTVPDRFAEIEKAIKAVFKRTREVKLTPVRTILGDSFSFDEIRLARLFFEE